MKKPLWFLVNLSCGFLLSAGIAHAQNETINSWGNTLNFLKVTPDVQTNSNRASEDGGVNDSGEPEPDSMDHCGGSCTIRF